jgi:quercetin dioxygenase-like cupin family protein
MSIISRLIMSADNKFINAIKRRTDLFKINIHALPKECRIQKTNNFTKYSLLNPKAGKGWNLELLDINKTISGHYNKSQNSIMVMMEGNLELNLGDKKILLGSGEVYNIAKSSLHSITPINGHSRCLLLDFSGFNFYEELFMNPIYEGYYYSKFNKADYIVYDLIPGELTNQSWSVAILEIKDSPRHYHRFGKEIFIVMNGELDLEIESGRYLLKPGELIEIPANKIHHLKSANVDEPVRVMCVNFPAFDPGDMHVM